MRALDLACLAFGEAETHDLSFKLPPGGIVGVIGPNGAGKTTLFRMINGLERAAQRSG
jgi:ABC-type multidrug transport system ATPase subunit